MHPEMHMQVDKPGRQDSIVAGDDCGAFRCGNRVARDVGYQAIDDQDIAGSEPGIDAIENADVFNEYGSSLRAQGNQGNTNYCEEAMHAVFHLVVVLNAANTIVLRSAQHQKRGVA